MFYYSENLLQGSIATDKDSRSSFQDRPPEKPRESVIRFDPSVDEDEYCSDEEDPDKVTFCATPVIFELGHRNSYMCAQED